MTGLFGFEPTILTAARLLAVLAAGYGAGLLHFTSLEAVARRMIGGRLSAFALQIGRLVALGLFLWLLARLGAPDLLAGTAGILLARSRVLARARRDA